ncbi:ABC transporter permease [Flavitalea sp. BT771]|uniref:ABC transporter permease n=1 Tax=Flavitalea sp. BT771 TaxID=3063329 RepID=UPI0026E21EB2|nr:ABC transporter permease [Flavitalea sp. BT771]MDO6432978.1 ABC transporter permease [Flavitalea sp. BT771]MDV6221746.1 ABC transporter permease [Flavitalea sp. BT771]
MLKNLIMTALRNFRKNRVSFFINVFGLTVGLTSCLLITLYIKHELSYDQFQTNGSRIARVIMEYHFDGSGDSPKGNFTSTKVAPAFRKNFPEVQSAVRMTDPDRIVAYRDKLFKETHFMYADSSFFDLFSMPLVRGDVRSALSGQNKVVVTESTAKKYFGGEDPIGKVLMVGADSVPYQVTGVMKDCPLNSQFRFDLLGSFSSLGENQEETYWEANYTTYLLLRDEAAFASLQAKLPAFMKKEMAGKGATINFYLEPFLRIHLYSDYGSFEPTTSISYIYILAGVALLILVIACSTYINLSTARSMERAREVGVRKVIGAGRGQLFWQFISESALVCGVAVMLSLVAAALLLPAFRRLTGRELAMHELLSLPFLSFSLLTGVVVSFLAGSYPAVVLTGFQPVKVLKGAFKNTSSGQGLRQSLIVFQFVISVFLIVSTFIMQQQLNFIQHKQLGYDRDHVLVLPTISKIEDIQLLRTELRRDPQILNVARSGNTPINIVSGYNMRNSTMRAGEQLAVNGDRIDEYFIPTMGLQLVAGENITAQDMKDAHPDIPPGVPEHQVSPTFHFILNESAARVLGWSPQEAVGKKMFMDETRPGYVRGVVKDFHFQSLHQPIKPLVLFPGYRANTILVKLSGRRLPETIAGIGATWKKLIPYMPFEYRFLDEDYNKMYRAEQRLGTVMHLFSLVAIVLACLGLFGLSAYAARQRVKEIGIRKVLGASIPQLVVLLSGGFIRMALVAIVIAIPLAWWAMHRWLQDFTYRAGVSAWVFAGAALLVVAITLATVGIQAVKAALMNPVKNLRTE